MSTTWVSGVRHSGVSGVMGVRCQALRGCSVSGTIVRHDTTAGIGGIYGLWEAAFRRVQVSFGADARDMPACGFFHPLSMMLVAQSTFLA